MHRIIRHCFSTIVTEARSVNQTHHFLICLVLFALGVPYRCLLRLEFHVGHVSTLHLRAFWKLELGSSCFCGKHLNHCAIPQPRKHYLFI